MPVRKTAAAIQGAAQALPGCSGDRRVDPVAEAPDDAVAHSKACRTSFALTAIADRDLLRGRYRRRDQASAESQHGWRMEPQGPAPGLRLSQKLDSPL